MMLLRHRYKKFMQNLDSAMVEKAIAEAEQKTSANIVVRISDRYFANPIKRAKERFAKLGLNNHPHHNCVLIYVLPQARKIAIIGDTEINKLMDDPKHGVSFHTWNTVVMLTQEHFRQQQYTQGLAKAIDAIAIELSTAFPPTAPRDNIPHDVCEDNKK